MAKNRTPTNNTRYRVTVLALILGIVFILGGLALLLLDWVRPYDLTLGTVDGSLLRQVPVAEVPEGALYITYARRQYGGDMLLQIPAIGLVTPIGPTTEPGGLEQMPGLYEFSQMPGDENGNVSIAGHRDIAGMEFFNLHLLGEGDYFYLSHDGTVYQYLYRGTEIVAADNWDVIKPQGYDCLTLTTCDPIGTSINRLIVTATLVGTAPDIESIPDGNT